MGYQLFFCENAECRTVEFDDRPTPNTNQPVENCPTCGRFGRSKDVKENDAVQDPEVPA